MAQQHTNHGTILSPAKRSLLPVDFQVRIIWINYEKIFLIKLILLERIMTDGKK